MLQKPIEEIYREAGLPLFMDKYLPLEIHWQADVIKINQMAEKAVKALVVAGMPEYEAYILVRDFWDEGCSSGRMDEAFENAGESA